MNEPPNPMHEALTKIQTYEDNLDAIARMDSYAPTRRLFRAAANALGRVRRAQEASTAPPSPTEAARGQGGGL